MKHDVWAFALTPGEENYIDFCINTGIVIVGWAEIDGYEDVIAKPLDKIEAAYKVAYSDSAWATDDNKNKAISALNKITNEIKIGDKILVRKGNGELVAVGDVTGDYKYRKDWVSRDMAHTRDVRYTAISRDGILFETMKKHLKKGFSMGHTIYHFCEVDSNIWDQFLEDCRSQVLAA